MKSKTPEYRAAYWKRYRQSIKPYVDKTCAFCGAMFRKKGVMDGTAKTCPDCRLGKCPTCGKPFKRGKLSQMFCSSACRYEPMKGKEPAALSVNRGVKPRTYLRSNARKRGGAEDREWRVMVFERDNFTCQICSQRGGRLQADHIKPVCAFPELRHVLSNGRTLCVECHKSTETYGSKARTYVNRLRQEVLNL